MLKFNELEIAEGMDRTVSFPNDTYNRLNVSIYAKYLKYKKIINSGKDYKTVTLEDMKALDAEVESELINFCKTAYDAFNYIVSFGDIDYAMKVSDTYKLRIPYPTPITKKEWDIIKNLEDDNMRRFLFAMLVDGKFHKMFGVYIGREIEINEDTIFYCNLTDKELYRLCKCKFKDNADRRNVLHTLYVRELVNLKSGEKTLIFPTIVDIDPNSQVVDYITDYDNVHLHYERLMGKNIGTCKHCGKLFKQNKKNNATYCSKHRSYINIYDTNEKIIKCKNCGKEFKVKIKNNKTKLCEECRKVDRKRYDEQYYILHKK